MTLPASLKGFETLDIFNISSVRNICELNKHAEHVSIKNLPLIDISVGNDDVWFHLEDSTIVNGKSYKSICEKTLGFLGFIGIILLDSEDTLEEIRLSKTQCKRRIIYLILKEDTEFLLCGIVYALENLPIKGQTLLKLRDIIKKISVTLPVSKLLACTCQKLISILRYIFYDDKQQDVLDKVPPIIQLYYESKTANIHMLNLFFKSHDNDDTCTLSLNTRRLQDDSKYLIDFLKSAICDAFSKEYKMTEIEKTSLH